MEQARENAWHFCSLTYRFLRNLRLLLRKIRGSAARFLFSLLEPVREQARENAGHFCSLTYRFLRNLRLLLRKIRGSAARFR